MISFVTGWQIGISTFYYADDKIKPAERSYMFLPDTVFTYSEYEELECLRLYKDINELSRSAEMSIAESEAVYKHKVLIFEYVEKACPDFQDLELIYNNYKQTFPIMDEK